MTTRLMWSLLFLGVFAGAAELSAEDWPQWLGPNRDSVWREVGIIEKFPADGPEFVWKRPLGLGYSGPSVADGYVYVMDYQLKNGDLKPNPGTRNRLEGQERIVCLDEKTGNEVWAYAYDCPYNISYPSGPRVTPTVDADRVYGLGAEGNLICVNSKTGEFIWGYDLKEEYGLEVPIWGCASHPFVDGDQLICLVGGEGSVVVSFDKFTGKELWKGLSASEPGYCPPSIIEAGGVRQLIIWHADAINSLNPATGEVYWSIPLKPDYGMSIAVPRKSGNHLFASGIGNVGALLRLDENEPKAEVVWRGKVKDALYSANATPFIEDGIIYGADCRPGALTAVRLSDGERLWFDFQATTGDRRAGHGTCFIVKNGDRFFLMSETGHLVIAELSAEGYNELSRAKLLEPTGDAFGRPVVWSHPAFANGCVFARNDKEIVCVSLKK